MVSNTLSFYSKIGFCAGTKVFEEALNAVKFLGWLRKFGLAQNILGHIKGQGISLILWAQSDNQGGMVSVRDLWYKFVTRLWTTLSCWQYPLIIYLA